MFEYNGKNMKATLTMLAIAILLLLLLLRYCVCVLMFIRSMLSEMRWRGKLTRLRYGERQEKERVES